VNPALHTAQANMIHNVPLEFQSDAEPAVGASNITPVAGRNLPPDPAREQGVGRSFRTNWERRLHVLHMNPYWHMTTPQGGPGDSGLPSGAGFQAQTPIPYDQLLILHYYQNREPQPIPGSPQPATVNSAASATVTSLARMPAARAVSR
jgi:hypothetical protein